MPTKKVVEKKYLALKKEKELNRQKVLKDTDMDEYIRYALEAESRKHQKIKKYE